MPQLSITTTQNVNINFNTAQVGERLVAYLLDLLVIAAYYFVVYFLIGQLLDGSRYVNSLDQWTIIAINGVISLPVLFYSLLLESFF